jgi:hypothetical protein
MRRAIKSATLAQQDYQDRARALEKKCPKCGVWGHFSAHANRDDGMQVHCKECMRAYRRQNRARLAVKDREYRRANQERGRQVKNAYWQKNKERLSTYHSSHYEANKKRIAARHRNEALLRQYGITNAEYEQQLERQRGLCPLCGVEAKNHGDRRGAIDHCHETGVVRGILCGPCNVGLQRIERDVSWAQRAAEYVRTGGIWGEDSDES